MNVLRLGPRPVGGRHDGVLCLERRFRFFPHQCKKILGVRREAKGRNAHVVFLVPGAGEGNLSATHGDGILSGLAHVGAGENDLTKGWRGLNSVRWEA